MNAINLIKQKGLYLTWIGYWHEIVKKYHVKRANLLHKGEKVTYSQYAEDLIIDRLTGYKEYGWYVDIGANDPIRFNNTKKFYERGWRGINVDPNPHCFKALEADRKNDNNVNAGIGLQSGVLPFYDFKETEISTFSKQRADKVASEGYTLRQVIDVPVMTLATLLNDIEHVDFMSIDAEDQNFDVLKSHDWQVRPTVICIENDASHDYETYLKQFGYKKDETTLLNSFFILCDA